MKDENQDATNHRDSWIALGIVADRLAVRLSAA